MSISRYLIYVSYIGTPFLGCQRQLKRALIRQDDTTTVQGQLEKALKILNPSNNPVLVISSRTDAGVHALSTTFHVDLYRNDGAVYEPKTITLAINKHFTKENIPIRIIKTYLVPDDFHCRHNSISRTYLYRFATIKADGLNIAPHLHHQPIEELERCYFLCTDTFDLNQMKDSAKLFLGMHDFRTFMHKSSQDPDKITRRNLGAVEILEERSLTYSSYSWPSMSDQTNEDYKFYNVYIKGTGFLYRQLNFQGARFFSIKNNLHYVHLLTLISTGSNDLVGIASVTLPKRNPGRYLNLPLNRMFHVRWFSGDGMN